MVTYEAGGVKISRVAISVPEAVFRKVEVVLGTSLPETPGYGIVMVTVSGVEAVAVRGGQ